MKDASGSRLALAVLTLVVFASSPTASRAQPIEIDWPLGTVLDTGAGDELVMGQDVYVEQNYRSTTCTCHPGVEHTGLDLQYDADGEDTVDAPVYAAADGRVECIDTEQWGHEGDVVVVGHPGGLYSVYGHLNAPHLVGLGAQVRRGQQIGTVQSWPGDRDNSHLHFEVRQFVYWSHDRNEPVDDPSDRPGETISCAGPGYAPDGVSLGSQPWDEQWLDPVALYYDGRPRYPRAVAVHGYLPNLAPGDDARTHVAVYPEADFDLQPIATLPGSSLVTALGIESAADSQNRTQRYYRVSYDGVNPGYILGFYFVGHDSDLRVGEPLGRWEVPGSRPRIHYAFGGGDLSRGAVRNWGLSRRRNNGTLHGGAHPVLREEIPGPDPNDYAIELDGSTAFISVDHSGHLRFTGGVTLEADVWREANADEDAIVGKWADQNQWLLTLYADGEGKLVFSLRLADGAYARVEYGIPDSSYLGRWVHVAAAYDPRDGLRLYWDRRLVAQKLAADLEAEGHALEDRRIARGGAPIHVGDAGNPWSRFRGRIDEVKVWR
jgi:murein DD-endopeptidase MepM/ murein hydrolase activator NlpD